MKPTDLKEYDVCCIKGGSGTVHFLRRTSTPGRRAINTFRTAQGTEFDLNDAEVTAKVSKAPWALS